MLEQLRTQRLQFRAQLDESGGDEGFLRARVCELDAVDRYGLTIARGGLTDAHTRTPIERATAVISSWTHSAVTLNQMPTMHPVGRGYVFEEGDFLMAEGHYDMGMTAGKDAYRAVKMLEDEVEFSILMQVIEQQGKTITRYDVSEWSACLKAVSYNTGVEEIRSAPANIIDPRLTSERTLQELQLRILQARGV